MLALNSKSQDCAKHVRLQARPPLSRGWALRDVISFFCLLRSVSVDQSGGLSMEIGVLYLSHAYVGPR